MFKLNIFKKYFFIEYTKIVLNVTLAFLALGVVLNIFEEVNFFNNKIHWKYSIKKNHFL